MFKKLIAVVMLFIHSSVLSMDNNDLGDEILLNPRNELGIVRALCHSRSQWFDEKIGILSDTAQEEAKRLEIAHKILSVTFEQMEVAKGISRPRQITMQKNKLIGNAISVLEFSKIFWCYFERTINFYLSTPNDSIDSIKTVLPHLAAEIKNFEEFALGDLRTDSKNSYFCKELLYAQKILDILNGLGQQFHIDVAKKAYAQDMHTNEILEYTPQLLATANLHMSQDPLKTSSKSVYFMEQIVSYRKASSYYDNPANRVNHKDPQILGFEQYILPATGPIFVQEVRIATVAPILEAQKKDKSKGPKNKGSRSIQQRKDTKQKHKVKQTHKELQSTATEKKNEVVKTPDVINATVSTITSFEDASNRLEVNGTDPLTTPTTETSPSAPSLTIVQKASYLSALKKTPTDSILKSNLPVTTTQSQPTTFKDMRLSKSYIFNGKEFSLDIFEQPCEQFDLNFLDTIKKQTFRYTSGLPNLVKASLDIHYQVGGLWYCEKMKFPQLFLSGGKSFAATCSMPQKFNIVTAIELLTKNEKNMIPHQERGKKSTYVGVCVEHQLLSRIAQGNWGKNHTHSEAVYALWLLNELSSILKNITQHHAGEQVQIKGLVSALQSFQDCCWDCQDLYQCLQGRMKDILKKMHIPNISVEPDFATLMLVGGYTRHPRDEPSQRLSTDPVLFQPNSHVFVTEPFSMKK